MSHALESLDIALKDVEACLAGNDVDALQAACARLSQEVQLFTQSKSRMLHAVPGQESLQTAEAAAFAARLSLVREQLARKSAMVRRMLGSLLPSVDAVPVYGKGGVGTARQRGSGAYTSFQA